MANLVTIHNPGGRSVLVFLVPLGVVPKWGIVGIGP